MRLTVVLGGATVSRNQDGTISVDALKAFNGQPRKFAQVGPDLFQEVNGQDRLGFKHDAATGRTTMAVAIPAMVFQKARWYENAPASRILILASVAVLLLALLFWPVGAAFRRHYGRALELSPPHRRLRMLVRLVALCVLIWLLSLLVFFVMASKNTGLLQARYNGWLRAIQVFAWLGVAGTVGVLYYLARTWFDGRAWFWTRLAYLPRGARVRRVRLVRVQLERARLESERTDAGSELAMQRMAAALRDEEDGDHALLPASALQVRSARVPGRDVVWRGGRVVIGPSATLVRTDPRHRCDGRDRAGGRRHPWHGIRARGGLGSPLGEGLRAAFAGIRRRGRSAHACSRSPRSRRPLRPPPLLFRSGRVDWAGMTR